MIRANKTYQRLIRLAATRSSDVGSVAIAETVFLLETVAFYLLLTLGCSFNDWHAAGVALYSAAVTHCSSETLPQRTCTAYRSYQALEFCVLGGLLSFI